MYYIVYIVLHHIIPVEPPNIIGLAQGWGYLDFKVLQDFEYLFDQEMAAVLKGRLGGFHRGLLGLTV